MVREGEEILDLDKKRYREIRIGSGEMVRIAERPALKIPYHGRYPSATQYLMDEDVISSIHQYERNFARWKAGVDIIYHLHGLGPTNFGKYADELLLAAYQECQRYRGRVTHVYAGFDVRLIRTSKGVKKGLSDIVTFQTARQTDPDLMVYGPDYAVDEMYYLKMRVQQILEIAKRYHDGVQKQRPFRVVRMFIGVRVKAK